MKIITKCQKTMVTLTLCATGLLFVYQITAMSSKQNAFFKPQPLFNTPARIIAQQIQAEVSDSKTFNQAVQKIINDRIATYKLQVPKEEWPLYLRQNPHIQARDMADYYLLNPNNKEEYEKNRDAITTQTLKNLLRPDLYACMPESIKNAYVNNFNELHAKIKQGIPSGTEIIPGFRPQLIICPDVELKQTGKFDKELLASGQVLIHHEFTHIEQQANINALNAMGEEAAKNDSDPAFRRFMASQGSMLEDRIADFLDGYSEDENGNPFLKETADPFFTHKHCGYLNEAEACREEVRWLSNPQAYKSLTSNLASERLSYCYPSQETILGWLKKYHPTGLGAKTTSFAQQHPNAPVVRPEKVQAKNLPSLDALKNTASYKKE